MKAKDLIKILESNPDRDVFIVSKDGRLILNITSSYCGTRNSNTLWLVGE